MSASSSDETSSDSGSESDVPAGGGRRPRSPLRVVGPPPRRRRLDKKRFGSVLPYARDADGTVRYLLGLEPGRGWTDFGGTADAGDRDLRHTAAREAHEESIGLLGSVDDIYEKCSHEYTVELDSAVFSGGCTYLMEIAYDRELPERFSTLRGGGGLHETQREKTELTWATLADIIQGSLQGHEMYDIFQNGFGMRAWMGGAPCLPEGESGAAARLARYTDAALVSRVRNISLRL